MAGADRPPDIWLASADFHSPRQLTHLNPELDKYRMGRSRLLEWRSADGELLHGALLLPAGYEAGKRYPLIVMVYGGLHLSNELNEFGGGQILALNIQLFATRGYVVLLPDAPQHLGTPMADLAKTILPGVERVVETGVADSSRVGVMGQSYGGYTTLALLVQTNRFAAAAMVDGFGDLLGMYGEMTEDGTGYGVAWSEERQGLMGGSPWQHRDRYIENSPIFYLDRVETPLLIAHGSADVSVAPFLGDEVFVALRRLGKEVEYAKYEGEGHSPLTWSHVNYYDLCARLIDWFDKYLKTTPSPAGKRISRSSSDQFRATRDGR
jgi:dipeptidyl aminopeptidase/acylaminoacyl peptidase